MEYDKETNQEERETPNIWNSIKERGKEHWQNFPNIPLLIKTELCSLLVLDGTLGFFVYSEIRYTEQLRQIYHLKYDLLSEIGDITGVVSFASLTLLTLGIIYGLTSSDEYLSE